MSVLGKFRISSSGIGLALSLAALGVQASTDPACSTASQHLVVPHPYDPLQKKIYPAWYGEAPDTTMKGAPDTSWYGDSRVMSACLLTPSGSNTTVVSSLRDILPKLASGGASYRLRAVSGTSLRELIEGTEGNDDANSHKLNKRWVDQVQDDKSPLIVLGFGANDAWKDRRDHRATGLAEFENNLRIAVTQALLSQTDRKVLLLQPYRACSFRMLTAVDPILPHPDTVIAPYANVVARVGNEFEANLQTKGRVEVAHLFSLPTRCHGLAATSDMPDGLHASDAFNRKVAERVHETLTRLRNGGAKPLPTLTITRAPLAQEPGSTLQPVSKLQPVPGQDLQMPIVGRHHVTNWSTTNASSLAFSCVARGSNGFTGSGNLTELIQAGYSTEVPNWTDASDCTWTVTGPGGTVVYPDTYRVVSQVPQEAPEIVVMRSPAPILIGKPNHLTFKTNRADSLKRECTDSIGVSIMPPKSEVNGDERWSETIPFWHTPRSVTCVWTATGPGGVTTYVETYHTAYR